MSIANISPAANATLETGDSFSCEITHTSATEVEVTVDGILAWSYTGGYVAGYEGTKATLSGVTTISIAKTAGWGSSPMVVSVTITGGAEAGTTSWSYYVGTGVVYPEGTQEYDQTLESSLRVLLAGVEVEGNIRTIDTDASSMNAVKTGAGRVKLFSTASGSGGGGGGGGAFGVWVLEATDNSAPSGDGYFSTNEPAPGDVSTIKIDQDDSSDDLSTTLAALKVGAILMLVSSSTYAVYQVVSSTDSGAYYTIGLTFLCAHPDFTLTASSAYTVSLSSSTNDHGNLTGLGDDDHTQYLLANGSRALADDLAVAASKTIDGRDLSVDGAKLDTVESGADVTDAANVAAAGAVMTGGATAQDGAKFTERGAKVNADASGVGQVYVKNTSQQQLVFVDDDGTEHVLNAGKAGGEWWEYIGQWTGVATTPAFGEAYPDAAFLSITSIDFGGLSADKEDMDPIFGELAAGDLLYLSRTDGTQTTVLRVTSAPSAVSSYWTVPVEYVSGYNSVWSTSTRHVRIQHFGAVNYLGATAAPTEDDDAVNTSGNGLFSVGSRWYDTTNDEEYVCLDASSGAAVWKNTTATGGGASNPTGGDTWTCGSVLNGAPGAGGMSFNVNGAASVATIKIADDGDRVSDWGALFASMNGGFLYASDGTNQGLYKVTAVTDSTGYWTFTVTASNASGTFTTSTDYDVSFMPAKKQKHCIEFGGRFNCAATGTWYGPSAKGWNDMATDWSTSYSTGSDPGGAGLLPWVASPLIPANAKLTKIICHYQVSDAAVTGKIRLYKLAVSDGSGTVTPTQIGSDISLDAASATNVLNIDTQTGLSAAVSQGDKILPFAMHDTNNTNGYFSIVAEFERD